MSFQKPFQPAANGDRSSLSFDKLELLESTALPTARRWANITGLRDQGISTLAYWGEDTSRFTRSAGAAQ